MIEEWTRDVLLWLTSHVEDEDTAGLLFGAGLIFTDHIFRLYRKAF